MADDLRARLIAAKISGAKTGQGYEFRTNENAADVALGVVAEWLRELAEMRNSSWLPVEPYAFEDPRDVVARALHALADALTQPSTEEKR